MGAKGSWEQARVARQEKVDAAIEKLDTAVEAMVNSEQWSAALTFAARFRSYSFQNTLLIWVQHMEAYQHGTVPYPFPSYVAGYGRWQDLGRQVRKGVHGYQILAPVTARLASATPNDHASWRRLARGEQADPGETVGTRMVGVKLATVFEVSQTDGGPLPEKPQPQLLAGQAPHGLWDGLARIVAGERFTLSTVGSADELGGANGVTSFAERTVRVRTDMDPAAQAKTLAHELGHVLLSNPDGHLDAQTHRGIEEVKAESFAMMVGAAHGLQTEQYSVPYVANWADCVPGKTPIEVVKQVCEEVRSAALSVLDQLSTAQIRTGDLADLDQATADPPSHTAQLIPQLDHEPVGVAAVGI